MNFLDGRIDHAQRKFVSQGLALDLGSQILSQLHGCETVTLGVRPEDVRLSVTEFAGGIPARIYVTEALGNETFASLNLGQGKIIARTDPALRLDMEAKVWVSFDEAKFHFFDAASGKRLQ
jgi:multiple sugar transport system ATP-binding protein